MQVGQGPIQTLCTIGSWLLFFFVNTIIIIYHQTRTLTGVKGGMSAKHQL